MKISHLVLLILSGTGVGLLMNTGACDGIRNECNDGIDNDEDGLIDGADPACRLAQEQTNARANNCGQGSSGLPMTNPACQIRTTGVNESDDPQCFDTLDNDGDGLIDFPEDLGCRNVYDNDENNPACSDGIDNDGDGLTDWHQDPGCNNSPSGISESTDPGCSDGRDNDGDGKVDYPADPGCDSRTDTTERDPECMDGIDNDGDGMIDFPQDPDCLKATNDREAA
ncbi:MAG: hypothetical protein V3T05_03605, partial [Myxococcota bacterium]